MSHFDAASSSVVAEDAPSADAASSSVIAGEPPSADAAGNPAEAGNFHAVVQRITVV